MKNKTKNKNKSKKVVKVAVDQTKPSESKLTQIHTDLHTDAHTPTHTPTHTPILPITADTASVSSGVSHEVPVDALDRRHNVPVDPVRSCESLNAGQTPSACRTGSDRDTPPNAELEDREIPQHFRDLEDGIRSPREQPRQSNLRLHPRDGWWFGDSDAVPQGSAARNENREPRYYRDYDFPYGRTEIIPCPIPRPRRPTASTSQHGTRGRAEPRISTIGIILPIARIAQAMASKVSTRRFVGESIFFLSFHIHRNDRKRSYYYI